jgi:hypothetical protein
LIGDSLVPEDLENPADLLKNLPGWSAALLACLKTFIVVHRSSLQDEHVK